MLSLMLITFQVRYTITANRLLRFVKSIPFIKDAVPDDVYGNVASKIVFAVLGVLLSVVRHTFFRFLYVLVLVLIGLVCQQLMAAGGIIAYLEPEVIEFYPVDADELVHIILTVWFFFSFLGGLWNAVTTGNGNYERDMIMLNYMHTDPKKYAQARILLHMTGDVLLYLPYFLVILLLTSMSVAALSALLLAYLAFSLVNEVLNLLAFRCMHRHFGKMPLSLFILPVIGAGIAVPLNLPAPNWLSILTNPLLPVGAAVAAVASVLYIRRYTLFGEIQRERIFRFQKLMDKMVQRQKVNANRGGAAGLNLEDAKNWSKGLRQEDVWSGKHDRKTGFDYLNAIFFDRHQRFFRKKIFQRVCILCSPLVVTATFALIIAFVKACWPVTFFQSEDEASTLSLPLAFNSAPLVFFIIYVASLGRVITASVFLNCDIHMLHYPYYRTKETILVSFKARFMVALCYNFIITSVLAVTAVGSLGLFFGDMDWLYALVLFALFTTMGVFFAFNDLFLYYVIQPYDSAGDSKSVVYKVINIVVYMVMYINLQNRFDFMIYTIVVLAATILYVGIGIPVLCLIAPKRFKLR